MGIIKNIRENGTGNRTFSQFQESINRKSFARGKDGQAKEADVSIVTDIAEINPLSQTLVKLDDNKFLAVNAGFSPDRIFVDDDHANAVWIAPDADVPEGLHPVFSEANPAFIKAEMLKNGWKNGGRESATPAENQLSMDHFVLTFSDAKEWNALTNEQKAETVRITTDIFSRHPASVARQFLAGKPGADALFVSENDTTESKKKKVDASTVGENGTKFTLVTPVHTNTDNPHFHVWSSRLAVDANAGEVSKLLPIYQNFWQQTVYRPALNEALKDAGIPLNFDLIQEDKEKALEADSREFKQRQTKAVEEFSSSEMTEEELEASVADELASTVADEEISPDNEEFFRNMARETEREARAKMLEAKRAIAKNALVAKSLQEIETRKKLEVELSSEIESHKKTSDELKSTAESLEETIKTLEKTSSELKSTKESLEKTQDDLENEQKTHKATRSELSVEIAAHETTSKKLIKVSDDLSKEVDTHNKTKIDLKAEKTAHEQTSKELTKTKEEFDETKQELKAFYESMADIFDTKEPENLAEVKSFLSRIEEETEETKREIGAIRKNSETVLCKLESIGVNVTGVYSVADEMIVQRVNDFATDKLIDYENKTAETIKELKTRATTAEANVNTITQQAHQMQSASDADKIKLFEALERAGIKLEMTEDGEYKVTPPAPPAPKIKGPGE